MTRAAHRSALLLILLCLAACDRTAGLAKPDPGYESFRVESFSLTDRHGTPADQSVLDGRYTVVDFFFTNCPIYCPGMSAVMKRVETDTAGTGVRLLSISVDGVNDTPDVIDAYADSLDADPDRWAFLTGDRAAVRRLCEQQFKLGVSIDTTRPIKTVTGETMDFIDHPTRLILVGPDRRILGMYSYTNEQQIDTLIARVRRLAKD
jgi:protein SCO1/2/putative membrane protein